jgi:hypothetical protein
MHNEHTYTYTVLAGTMAGSIQDGKGRQVENWLFDIPNTPIHLLAGTMTGSIQYGK